MQGFVQFILLNRAFSDYTKYHGFCKSIERGLFENLVSREIERSISTRNFSRFHFVAFINVSWKLGKFYVRGLIAPGIPYIIRRMIYNKYDKYMEYEL